MGLSRDNAHCALDEGLDEGLEFRERIVMSLSDLRISFNYFYIAPGFCTVLYRVYGFI